MADLYVSMYGPSIAILIVTWFFYIFIRYFSLFKFLFYFSSIPNMNFVKLVC